MGSAGGRRFGGKAGREYRLFLRARPHYALMQSLLRSTLKRAVASMRGGGIAAVEIGCGQGDTSRGILSSDARISLVGIDNEPLMVGKARAALRKEIRSGRARIARADALAFLKSLPSGSVDAVASAFTLHNFPRGYRRSVHRQIFRVLRDGGVFINADKYAEEDKGRHRAALDWQLSRFRLFDEEGRPDLRRAWTRHYLDDEKPGRLMRASESVAGLRRLGFAGVRITHRNHLEALLIARKKLKPSRHK
jgi:tRNA (cmo5U34)-methyltransferase